MLLLGRPTCITARRPVEFMARDQRGQGGRDRVDQRASRPDQQIVKIVHDELIELDGAGRSAVDPAREGRADGFDALRAFQGSGQDDNLRQAVARLLASGVAAEADAGGRGLAAAVRRRLEQLKVIGTQVGVPVFSQTGSTPRSPFVRQQAVASKPPRQGCDTLILDTAGRLHVDDELMSELTTIEKKVKPHQVFFVCDSSRARDAAVASAEGPSTRSALELDGVHPDEALDGDAWADAAALSVRRGDWRTHQVCRQG